MIRPLLIAGLLLLAASGAAFAQTDHRNLEEGLPVEVEDAYPTAYLNRELQLVTRYDRKDGKDLFVVDPRFEYGFAKNWQAKLTVPLRLGTADKTGSGDIGAEVFYNFNMESLSAPAFAVSGKAIFPTGRDRRGVDAVAKVIATKTLGWAPNLDRLHLNASYRFNAEPGEKERSGQFMGALGYSRRLGPNFLLVTDYVFEQEREEDKESQMVEAGMRYQHDPLTILTFGIGAGLTRESPDFRATLGFQRALTF